VVLLPSNATDTALPGISSVNASIRVLEAFDAAGPETDSINFTMEPPEAFDSSSAAEEADEEYGMIGIRLQGNSLTAHSGIEFVVGVGPCPAFVIPSLSRGNVIETAVSKRCLREEVTRSGMNFVDLEVVAFRVIGTESSRVAPAPGNV